MKPGCYFATDERVLEDGARRCTPIVHVFPEVGDDHAVRRLVVTNLSGSGMLTLAVVTEHVDFVDDEENGVLVAPTAQGKVTFLWPTAERFDAMEPSAPVEWPDTEMDDEQRQHFLKALTGDAV